MPLNGVFWGLDNIGVFDRNSALPTGGNLEQSDGTAWMALYAQIMLRIGQHQGVGLLDVNMGWRPCARAWVAWATLALRGGGGWAWR